MSKYSKAFKLKVIEHYLSGRDGYRSTSSLYGVNYAYIRKWVLAFKAHGQDSLNQRYKNYTSATKLAILQYMQRHQLSISQATAHFNIPSPSTISLWQRLYNEGGITALEPKPKGRPPMSKPLKPFVPTDKPVNQMTTEELMQELEYRRVETDYLKKLEALAQQKHLASKNKSK